MSWLTLQEYSIQTGISVSTLRRKIKNKEFLNCKISNGRYLLKLKTRPSNPASPTSLRNYNSPLHKSSSLNTKTPPLSLRQKLHEKSQELEFLKRDHEDLLSLVHFLEQEKKDLLKQIIESKNLNLTEPSSLIKPPPNPP